MPDVNGQMQLQDYRSELMNRGFDGFAPADLDTFVNRGYMYVARKFPEYWNLADYVGAVPDDGKLNVADVGSLSGFKSVEAIYWRNSSQGYYRLRALPESEYRDAWAPEYQAGVKGNPQVYYIDGNTLWVLPRMADVGNGTIEIRYNRRPALLTSDTSVPVTPIDYDEIILSAAVVRAHKRANEPNLAFIVQNDVDEAISDALDLEATRMQDVQERVSPDDTWA